MKDNYYFDNAATSWPKPEVVYTTMDQLFRNYGVNPGRAGHEMAVEAEKMIEETR
ncbi:MAG: aminotransferase class V-fold PLP-dependent enzyme, partial [Gammaproteobacteria bacterium]